MTKPAESPSIVGKRLRTPTTRATTGRPSTVRAIRPSGPADAAVCGSASTGTGSVSVGCAGRNTPGVPVAEKPTIATAPLVGRGGRGRRAYPAPGAERDGQRWPAGGQHGQRPERDARGSLSRGARVFAVLMTVGDGESGWFVELQSLELPPSARHGDTQDRGASVGRSERDLPDRSLGIAQVRGHRYREAAGGNSQRQPLRVCWKRRSRHPDRAGWLEAPGERRQ